MSGRVGRERGLRADHLANPLAGPSGEERMGIMREETDAGYVPTGSPILLRRPWGACSSSSSSLVAGMWSPPLGCSVGFSCLSAMVTVCTGYACD